MLDYRRLFVDFEWESGGSWALIDLEAGGSHRYRSGERAISFGIGGAPADLRWLTLVNVLPDEYPGPDEDVLPVSILDARTGDLVLIEELTQTTGATIATTAWTPDGHYTVVSVYDDDGATLWRADSESTTAEQVVEGSDVLGYFSPDGCWMVLMSAEESGDGISGVTEIVPLRGGVPVLTIEGYSVVWVAS
ncbi:MAG: hypothetical protein ACRDJH_10615 [Thermomicrobiales bacterium]